MTTSIIGYGFVGKAIHKLFPNSLILDPATPDISASQEDINKTDVAFVCVPTNMLPDGTCDTSIVEATIDWLETSLIIIRSTVKPGTTEALRKKYPNKHIIFQPEYIGETVGHPMNQDTSFIVLGGDEADTNKAVLLYQTVYNSSVKIILLTATEAELAKYMTNSAIGNMVTFINEFYNIINSFGANYHKVREAFLADPRMSRYFTFVYPEKRGFSGKCIPKDMNAITKASEAAGYKAEFIESILKNNERLKK